MTIEEAKEIIKKNKPVSDPRKCGKELCEACDVVIEALKKQIPKKPIRHDSHVVPWYICPSCGKIIADRYQGIKSDHRHCSVCGQLLDWKDEIKNM